MAAFIQGNPKCFEALQAEDYATVGKIYNGTGKPVEHGESIRTAIAAYRKVTKGKFSAD